MVFIIEKGRIGRINTVGGKKKYILVHLIYLHWTGVTRLQTGVIYRHCTFFIKNETAGVKLTLTELITF